MKTVAIVRVSSIIFKNGAQPGSNLPFFAPQLQQAELTNQVVHEVAEVQLRQQAEAEQEKERLEALEAQHQQRLQELQKRCQIVSLRRQQTCQTVAHQLDQDLQEARKRTSSQMQALEDHLSESIGEQVKRARRAAEADAAATKRQLEKVSDDLLRTHRKQQRVLKEEVRLAQQSFEQDRERLQSNPDFILQAQMKCQVCFDDKLLFEGLKCSNGHFISGVCFPHHVTKV